MKTDGQILISGYYGRRNAGDELILQGILSALRAHLDDPSFVVVSANPEETHNLHNVRAITNTEFQSLLNEVSRSSIVIVGGGGLFQDYWGFDETAFLSNRQGGISEFGGPLLLAYLLDKPSMLCGVGVGPLMGKSSERATRFLFRIADEVIVRDLGSKQVLDELGLDGNRIYVAPDPAFSAPRLPVREIAHEVLGFPRPILGVSVRPWEFGVDPVSWEREIAQALDCFLERHGGTVLFIPMQDGYVKVEDDVEVCHRIGAGIRHSDLVMPIMKSLNPLERISLLGACDLVLGMRLHSLIGSMRHGVPCVAIVYDSKVEALMRDAEMLDFSLPLDSLSSRDLSEVMGKAYRTRDKLQKHIKSYASASAEEVEAIGPRVREMLGKELTPKEGDEQLLATVLLSQFRRRLQIESQYAQTQNQLRSSLDKYRQVRRELDQAQYHIQAREEELEQVVSQLDGLQMDHVNQALQLQQIKANLKATFSDVKRLKIEKEQIQTAHEQIRQEMEHIKSSKGWRLLWIVWRIIWRFRESVQGLRTFSERFRQVGSSLGHTMTNMIFGIRNRARTLLPIWMRALISSLHAYRYDLLDRSRVELYTDDEGYLPDYRPRRPLNGNVESRVRFSLISTVKNEAQGAEAWLRALEGQSRAPDEVIFIDAGSTDGTLEILQDFTRRSSLEVRVYEEEGVNIARGRNLAIERATHDIIAVADFGSDLSRNYLKNIIRPFEVEPNTQVVAGWFEAKASTRVGKWIKHQLVPSLEDIDPQTFLPSARSIAFRRTAWHSAGRYPEWLTMTGDDTYFALELKRHCPNWAFVPDAYVYWHAPGTLKAFWQKLVAWSSGDGESNIFAERYWTISRAILLSMGFVLIAMLGVIGSVIISSIVLAGIACLAILVVLFFFLRIAHEFAGSQSNWVAFLISQVARSIGFYQGVIRRPVVRLKQHGDVTGIAYVLSGVPIDDTGGGARGAQIAKELLRRNYFVVYVYRFLKDEHVDLMISVWHPRLYHSSIRNFDWKAFQWEYAGLGEKPSVAIVEFPLLEFIPLIREIKRSGGKVVYERIDAWETSLGGRWYSSEVEREIVAQSDVLTATAAALAERLETMSDRPVYLLPNAVDGDLFERKRRFRIPADFPQEELVLIYVGALWGDWFDWSLLNRIARDHPHAAVVVVGDYDRGSRVYPSNLHFLGLKAQEDLPAYLSHADVAIIPWRNCHITRSTSPLKVYEYLAMGLPVVAPHLPPLEGIPNVFLAPNADDFVRFIERANHNQLDEEILDHFVRANTWNTRIGELLGHVAQD